VYAAIVSDGADGARETSDFSFRVIDSIETRLGEYEYATVALSDGMSGRKKMEDGRWPRLKGEVGNRENA
jgi:hypothetical protein